MKSKKKVQKYMNQLFSSLHHAMELQNSGLKQRQFIHNIELIQAKQYYGYTPTKRKFLKLTM